MVKKLEFSSCTPKFEPINMQRFSETKEFIGPPPRWGELSGGLKQAIIISNALPEKFEDERRKPESWRQQEGIDAEREQKLLNFFKDASVEDRARYEEYLKLKQKYFTAMALHFRPFMKLLEEGRMLGKQGVGWKAVSRHTLVVAELSGLLAEQLAKCGENVSAEEIRTAGMLHDLSKRSDIEYKKELELAGEKNIDEKFLKHEREAEWKLLQSGAVRSAVAKLLPNVAKDEKKYKRFANLAHNVGNVELLELVENQKLDPAATPLDNFPPFRDVGSIVLYYVDLLVKYTSLVSWQERSDDFLKRFTGKEGEEGVADFRLIQYERAITPRLEKDLAVRLGIKGEQMQEYLAELLYNKVYKVA